MTRSPLKIHLTRNPPPSAPTFLQIHMTRNPQASKSTLLEIHLTRKPYHQWLDILMTRNPHVSESALTWLELHMTRRPVYWHWDGVQLEYGTVDLRHRQGNFLSVHRDSLSLRVSLSRSLREARSVSLVFWVACSLSKSLTLLAPPAAPGAWVANQEWICRSPIELEVKDHRDPPYSWVPVHRNHSFDPASVPVFLSTHWWSQHPACQRCFYKPVRNCLPNQRVSTPPGARGKRRGFSPGSAARHSQSARVHTDFFDQENVFYKKIRDEMSDPEFGRFLKFGRFLHCG